MAERKRSLKEIAALCASMGPEDGIHPRHLKKEASRTHKHHTASRLSSEVEKTLSLALAGSLADPILSQLAVERVEASADGSRLVVHVRPSSPEGGPSEGQALAALSRAAGRLRAEVAAAVTRRHAPELSFRYVPAVGEVDA